MVEAAPTVVFGVEDEAAFDQVAVDVLELFDILIVAGDVEVVVAALPELFLVGGFELAGGQLLEDLQEGGYGACRRFVGEEMDVLGHENVGGYAEVLLFAGLFEDLLDCIFCFSGVEEGLTLVATEGDEVELPGLLEAF